MSSIKLTACTEAMLANFAGQLAAFLQPGDVVFLRGELGAGKTSFARALIRAIANDPALDVQSPTFPLLNTYAAARFSIAHFDLYRIEDTAELEEVGIYDDLSEALTLIEWPERLCENDFRKFLTVHLTERDNPDQRDLELSGIDSAAGKVARFSKMRDFIASTEWHSARWEYLQGDASTRSYIRLRADNKTALLMNAPNQPDGPPIRDGKSYSEIAHLAEGMTSFVAIASALKKRGFTVPEVSKYDLAEGFLLIKDLGDHQFFAAINNDASKHAELANIAIDVLAELHSEKPSDMPVGDVPYRLPKFDNAALSIETELVLDWYWPGVKNKPADAAQSARYRAAWHALFDLVQQNASDWVLRDYHSPNLMLCEGDNPRAKVGIIDFQDAMRGHAAYDVVSLCQDARLTVPADLEQSLKQQYISLVSALRPDFDTEEFNRAYAILGAQRACKLLGIFVRLAKRDGKHSYISHIPRIWDYLERNFAHPSLAEIETWFDDNFPTSLRKAAWEQH